MIKRLRRRFIALSMASLLVVLVLIIGSIDIVNYRHVTQEADSTLAVLAENGGAFPMPAERRMDGGPGTGLSPEAPYESRFFSVLLTAGGDVLSVDTGRIAAVDMSAAIDYAQRALDSIEQLKQQIQA